MGSPSEDGPAAGDLERLNAVLGGFPCLQCPDCGRTIYWGTEQDPTDLEGALKAHVCLKKMSREKFNAMFNWHIIDRWRIKNVGSELSTSKAEPSQESGGSGNHPGTSGDADYINPT